MEMLGLRLGNTPPEDKQRAQTLRHFTTFVNRAGALAVVAGKYRCSLNPGLGTAAR